MESGGMDAGAGGREQAMARLRAGDAAGAAEQFRALVSRAPGDPQAWAGLGIALCQLQQAEEGAAALERAVALAPNQAALHYNLARAREVLGRAPEALRSYHRT